ncbi:monocarboxylate transporter 12 isoform X2 [Megachile rotundata]|uniref:monocarboxylate transporter 12 isoform X2 n=1 Tax=Megachile rotundata TaxID=143995 RepID=UPI0006153401|nr:PREDICTED: monocarboxylate transporter 12 isoform X3 [Megachile rotundata]
MNINMTFRYLLLRVTFTKFDNCNSMAHATVSSSAETKKQDKKNGKKNFKCDSMDCQITSAITDLSPPDGGWGYFVVFASFLIHVIADGVTYSFGVFYLEFLYYFEEGKGTTAWIASILVGVTLCSGPISSLFVNKYGCRTVTIVGSILASACLLASVWAQNVITLYFTIGIGTGLGFGLIYLPAIVSVTCYFEKYRSLATGIAVCGSGLGTLIFAPCLKYFIVEYGWRGAIMICSGIVLNCIVLGALFRPLETNKQKKRSSPEKTLHNSLDQQLKCLPKGEHSTELYAISFKKERNNVGVRSLSQPILISKDITRQDNLENIHKEQLNLTQRYSEEVFSISESSTSLSTKAEYMKSKNGQFKINNKTKINTLQEILDISLLKNPVFLLFIFSNFCTSIGFYVPYVYVLPQAEERGIDKNDASYLLAVIGIANTAGRIILGYVSDKPWVNRLLIYNLCLTICGISTMLSIICTSFVWFTIYASIFGFTSGAYVGLTSVILVDLLGLNYLTNAFGQLLLFQGFASFLGPPIAGWLYDMLQSYDPGFLAAGSMITFSGLILFFVPIIQQKTKHNVSNKRVKNTINNEPV